jgi:hypothetical protein
MRSCFHLSAVAKVPAKPAMEWIASSHPLAAVTQRERYSLYPIFRSRFLRQAIPLSSSTPLLLPPSMTSPSTS